MDVYECLRSNGWYQGRSNVLLFTRLCLIKEGYVFHLAAKNFLKEFGGLKIVADDIRIKNGIDFNACEAARGIDSSWVTQEYSERLNSTSLCVIGKAYEEHMILFMDNEGKIYGGFDDLLYFISNDSISAIDIIINAKPIHQL